LDNGCPLTKKALDLNQMIRKDLIKTSLLKKHHKRNPKNRFGSRSYNLGHNYKDLTIYD